MKKDKKLKNLPVTEEVETNNEEIMVKIENVGKTYKLGQIGGTTLTEELHRLWAKIRKKEDPTKKIGAKNYNKGEKFDALKSVSFEVKKGEAIGLIGHNGAGKSTLLKLITRVTAPTRGKIYLNGRIASMLEVGTGFHRELTGRENIYMNGAILGMTKKEIDSKIEDIIEFSEVREFIDTPVKRYSSGMFVKLAFSVAAHLDAEIMLMDEVLAVGDMAFQNKCINKMREVADSGRTILYVSHNMNTIRKLCDRVVVLDHGEVVFNGDVEEGISAYMGLNDKLELFYDYTKRDLNHKKSLELQSLTILDKETACYDQGERIKFLVKCKANESVNNCGIRLEISSQSGELLGTTFIDKLFNVKKGQEVEILSELNTECFAPGKYRAAILTYEKCQHENQIGIDKVAIGLQFEIGSKNNRAGLLWNSSWWGHLQFEDLKSQVKIKGE